MSKLFFMSIIIFNYLNFFLKEIINKVLQGSGDLNYKIVKDTTPSRELD